MLPDLRHYQLPMYESAARVDMTVSAPQIGKSLTLGLWLLSGAWVDGGRYPDWPSWWTAPVYDQARSGFLRYVVRPALNAGILRHDSYTTTVPLRACLVNGSVIEARSWEKPESLYGPTVARVAIDEFGFLTQQAWAAISSRTTETALYSAKAGLLARLGLIRMAGNVGEIGGTAETLFLTAQNRNAWLARTWTWRHRALCAECFCRFEGDKLSIDLAEQHDDTCERGVYLRDLLDRRAVLSAAHFRQLYDAEWIDWSALPAYTFDRGKHVDASVAMDVHLPLDLSVDFNVDPMCWVVGQATHNEAWDLDEIVIEGSATTQQACEAFLARYPGHHTQPLRVFGDASGKARTTKSKKTDYSIMAEMLKAKWPNLSFHVPGSNPAVTDRLNTVNALLLNANGETRYHVHPRCERLAKDYARVGLKKGTREIDKSNKDLTHASDAAGYRLFSLFRVDVTPSPVVVQELPMHDDASMAEW